MEDNELKMAEYKDFSDWVKDKGDVIKTDEQNLPEVVDDTFTEKEINSIVEEFLFETRNYMDFHEFETTVLAEAKAQGIELNEKWYDGIPLAAATGAGAVAVGAGITAAAPLAGVVGASYLVGMLTSTLIRNRKAIQLKILNKWGKTTRAVVHKMYLTSIKALISKKKLSMKVKSKGEKIIIYSKYKFPGFPPAKLVLTITEGGITLIPENTGGSDALESIMFNAGTMDINPKRKTSNAIKKVIEDAGGLNNILGNGYKIPSNRVLNYREDMGKMWYIIVDMLSEIFADYAQHFTKLVASLQRSKVNDSQPFLQMMDNVKLDETIYHYAVMKGREMVKKGEHPNKKK